MATNARGSMLVNDPVISNRRTIPVSGARTIAEKNPVMAKMMKLFIYAESSPRYRMENVPKRAPMIAPRISKGKKMPPGAPDPKLIIEKMNLTRKSTVRNPRPLDRFRYSIAAWPPPKTAGNTRLRRPARKNGIITRIRVLDTFLYSFCVFSRTRLYNEPAPPKMMPSRQIIQ